MAQYEVNNSSIQTLLSWIRSGEIAIPEIQRPFVWDSTKVRDLIDSLYAGFPVGYIIVWKNPDVRLKDGTISSGKKILIDGQQRITALQAAIVGEPVIGSNYRKKRIKIAFHPLEQRFEVANPAIEKDGAWIPDIAPLYQPGFDSFNFVIDYCIKNQLDNSKRSAVNDVLIRRTEAAVSLLLSKTPWTFTWTTSAPTVPDYSSLLPSNPTWMDGWGSWRTGCPRSHSNRRWSRTW